MVITLLTKKKIDVTCNRFSCSATDELQKSLSLQGGIDQIHNISHYSYETMNGIWTLPA